MPDNVWREEDGPDAAGAAPRHECRFGAAEVAVYPFHDCHIVHEPIVMDGYPATIRVLVGVDLAAPMHISGTVRNVHHIVVPEGICGFAQIEDPTLAVRAIVLVHRVIEKRAALPA